MVVQVLDPAGHFSHLDCWQSSPRIHAWLQKNFPGSEERHGDNAYIWFVDQIASVLQRLGKRPMLWDDVSASRVAPVRECRSNACHLFTPRPRSRTGGRTRRSRQGPQSCKLTARKMPVHW